MDRREFLKTSSLLAAGSALSPPLVGDSLTAGSSQTFQLNIGSVPVELAPGHVVHTVGYNGQVPGPLLRMREGETVSVEVKNRTGSDERIHWHGVHLGYQMDETNGEGSSVIAPGESLRHKFVCTPSGSRWYHAHTGGNLEAANYTGQYGFLYIDPKHDPGRYDQEVFLAVHHWNPSLIEKKDGRGESSEITYQYGSFNDKILGACEPLRVKQGQRVLFHFLNASPTEDVLLAFPRHRFKVLALDGNPVPNSVEVEVLSLGVSERVDALVEMTEPGKWILGSTSELERGKGLGLVVEYADRTGEAIWEAPLSVDWHYGLFSGKELTSAEPAKLTTMLFEKKIRCREGMGGRAIASVKVRMGERHRVRLVNATDSAHPVHIHHSFELKRVAEVSMAGILKDTVRLPAYGVVDVDLLPKMSGRIRISSGDLICVQHSLTNG